MAAVILCSMFSSAEENGFSSLCSSEESPKIALMGVLATGLALLFGRMSSRSRSELDDRSPEEIAEDEQILIEQNANDPRWLYVKDLKSPIDGLRQLRKAAKLSKSPLLTKWVLSSSWPEEWQPKAPGWLYGLGTYAEKNDPRPYIPNSGQIKVVQGLLEDGAAPEALLYATHCVDGHAAYMPNQRLMDAYAESVDDVARQIDRKVAPISRQEDRLRVASAISDLSGGAYSSHSKQGFDHSQQGMMVTCAFRPISEACRELGATGSLSYEPFVATLPGAAHVEAARLAAGEPLEKVYAEIPRKAVVQRLARIPRISAESLRTEIVQNECDQNLDLVPDDLKKDFSEFGDRFRDRPKVARWIQGVCQDKSRFAALFTKRQSPHLGRLEEYRIYDRLHYIEDRDIEKFGESVTQLFDRARSRREKEEIEKHMSEGPDVPLGNVPPWWPERVIDSLRDSGVTVKQLVTPRQLVDEGREMDHCVGDYLKAVRKGSSYIASISGPDGIRSTVEFRCDGSIRQHSGIGNSSPDTILLKAVTEMKEESKSRYSNLPEIERLAVCGGGRLMRDDDD